MAVFYKDQNEHLAHEAFIRRASKLQHDFMLKGSYITRQYFSNPSERIPADLDWSYLPKIENPENAETIFSTWVVEVTEMALDDNVTFRSFNENRFWRGIDYAMADDFPTVNTDIKCWVGQTQVNFSMDISFNLPINIPPVPLQYQTIAGERFVVPKTVPLALQISWKIHQTLVRPRFKDLFDLIHLVQHPSFTVETRDSAFKELLQECQSDNVSKSRILYFLNYKINLLFPNNSIDKNWHYWRFGELPSQDFNNILSYDQAIYITSPHKIPENLSLFISLFKEHMEKAGFDQELAKKLPEDTIIPMLHFESDQTIEHIDNKNNILIDEPRSERIEETKENSISNAEETLIHTHSSNAAKNNKPSENKLFAFINKILNRHNNRQ